jgi:hypothetical protein
MSKYDTIKTAADLVTEVRLHGLSTEQDDKNRAADIFGNSSIKALADLANDAQCKNANGFSTGKPATSDTFYFILYNIWNWREATAFFNEHTNPVTKDAKETAAELRQAKKDIKEFLTVLGETWGSMQKLAEEKIYEHNERVKALVALDTAQHEIIKLKAKLYDFMSA